MKGKLLCMVPYDFILAIQLISITFLGEKILNCTWFYLLYSLPCYNLREQFNCVQLRKKRPRVTDTGILPHFFKTQSLMGIAARRSKFTQNISCFECVFSFRGCIPLYNVRPLVLLIWLLPKTFIFTVC